MTASLLPDSIPFIDDADQQRLEAIATAMPTAPELAFVTFAKAAGMNLKRDFRGADLRDYPLAGQNLSGVDLTGADLRGADLRGATGYDSTTILLERALMQEDSLPASADPVVVWTNRWAVLDHQGRWAEIYREASELLTCRKPLGVDDVKSCKWWIAVYHSHIGEYKRSINLLRDILRRKSDYSERDTRSIKRHLAAVHELYGDYKSSLNLCLSLFDDFRSQFSISDEERALTISVAIKSCLGLERIEDARIYALDLLNIISNTSYLENHVNLFAYSCIGMIDHFTGDYERAAANYRLSSSFSTDHIFSSYRMSDIRRAFINRIYLLSAMHYLDNSDFDSLSDFSAEALAEEAYNLDRTRSTNFYATAIVEISSIVANIRTIEEAKEFLSASMKAWKVNLHPSNIVFRRADSILNA